jgi:cyclic pyranopterin phosphate synthase
MMTRRDDLERVHEGLRAAREVGFKNTKIDTVAINGVNDGEFVDLIEFGRSAQAEVRFIEYMDVGGATRWRMDRVVTRNRILEILSAKYGSITEVARVDAAPADRFALPDGTTFGIISSVTQPFCATCDRARLTADGMWFTCLYAEKGTDLRQIIRSGASDDELRNKLIEVWAGRTDRGAEVRAGMTERAPLAEQANLRDNPHLEMHTRGG